jgi:hypothetical protein
MEYADIAFWAQYGIQSGYLLDYGGLVANKQQASRLRD